MQTISAIIPARNEEANIVRVVESLAAQPEVREIVLIDDQSTDATAQRMEELRQRFKQVRLARTEMLPPGWTGKNFAIWQGLEETHGDWLLFTDADTQHLPGSAARALRDASEHNALLVSYSPEQEMGTWWEEALLPFIFCRLGRHFSYARINDRIASYIKTNYPGKIVGINGYGMSFGNPADLPYVVNMTRNADYLIDIQDTVRQSDPSYRRRLIAAIAPAAFGGITTPNVEPPQHWERDRWFLPITKRMAINLQELYNDGGRAAENYMRASSNPGDEVAIRLAAAIELNPTADWRQQLDGILADIYQPQDQTARQQLLDLFLQAEDAYFNNASGYGPASIVELEPLIGSSPGPAIYLTQHMNAQQLANYRSALVGLRAQAQSLVSRVGNQTRMQTVIRSIDGALADIDAIRL